MVVVDLQVVPRLPRKKFCKTSTTRRLLQKSRPSGGRTLVHGVALREGELRLRLQHDLLEAEELVPALHDEELAERLEPAADPGVLASELRKVDMSFLFFRSMRNVVQHSISLQ